MRIIVTEVEMLKPYQHSYLVFLSLLLGNHHRLFDFLVLQWSSSSLAFLISFLTAEWYFLGMFFIIVFPVLL